MGENQIRERNQVPLGSVEDRNKSEDKFTERTQVHLVPLWEFDFECSEDLVPDPTERVSAVLLLLTALEHLVCKQKQIPLNFLLTQFL